MNGIRMEEEVRGSEEGEDEEGGGVIQERREEKQRKTEILVMKEFVMTRNSIT
jgi:hypothetical protein